MLNLEDLLVFAFAGFIICLGVITFILEAFRRGQFVSRGADFHHGANQMPIPRYGGIGLVVAFMGTICLPLLALWDSQPDDDAMRWVIASLALAMFGLGFWDDLRGLRAKFKLFGQLAISSTAYFLGLGIHEFKIPLSADIIDLGVFGWPVTVLWLVTLTNLINLIDGADGLAGGISLMLMILLSVVSDSSGMPYVAVGMAGALVAFLWFNAPPAKIYLGDGGAYFLGFLIGCLTIYNSQKGTIVAALIAPLFVLVLPILDTSLALLRRGMQGLPLFRPDRRHLHHRLLQSGVSREDLALGAYVFTAFFLVLGLVAFWWRGQGVALVVGGATLALLLLATRFSFCREWFNVRSKLEQSMVARDEIQYTLALTTWLTLEGTRGRDAQSICEDTAFIARKLGFATLCIHLEDNEKAWDMIHCDAVSTCSRTPAGKTDNYQNLANPAECRCQVLRHHLPGNKSCWIELRTPPGATTGSKYQLLSELLAEGWAKALNVQHGENKLPVRFTKEPMIQ